MSWNQQQGDTWQGGYDYNLHPRFAKYNTPQQSPYQEWAAARGRSGVVDPPPDSWKGSGPRPPPAADAAAGPPPATPKVRPAAPAARRAATPRPPSRATPRPPATPPPERLLEAALAENEGEEAAATTTTTTTTTTPGASSHPPPAHNPEDRLDGLRDALTAASISWAKKQTPTTSGPLAKSAFRLPSRSKLKPQEEASSSSLASAPALPDGQRTAPLSRIPAADQDPSASIVAKVSDLRTRCLASLAQKDDDSIYGDKKCRAHIAKLRAEAEERQSAAEELREQKQKDFAKCGPAGSVGSKFNQKIQEKNQAALRAIHKLQSFSEEYKHQEHQRRKKRAPTAELTPRAKKKLLKPRRHSIWYFETDSGVWEELFRDDAGICGGSLNLLISTTCPRRSQSLWITNMATG